MAKRVPAGQSLEALADTLEGLSNRDLDRLVDLLEARKSRFLEMADSRESRLMQMGSTLGDFAKVLAHIAQLKDTQIWILKKVIERRSPKRRKADRDATIVRLYDEGKVSFGRMGKCLLAINPAWAGKDGKPLSRAAAEKAYHRHKSRAGH
jgi:hypothetical protein